MYASILMIWLGFVTFLTRKVEVEVPESATKFENISVAYISLALVIFKDFATLSECTAPQYVLLPLQ